MNFLDQILRFPPIVFYFLFLWSLMLKGFALWRSAKYDQKNWFIVILVLNTIGILEIVYLFGFAKKKLNLMDLKFWEAKK